MRVGLTTNAVLPLTTEEDGQLFVEVAVKTALESWPDLRPYITMQGEEHREMFLDALPPDDGIRWTCLPKNIGEPKGQNVSIGRALDDGCDLIISCNDDVIFQRESIPQMVAVWQAVDKPGMVGPVTNDAWTCCGQVIHDAGFIDPDGRKQVPYLNGFCFMTHADQVKDGMLFDERMPPYVGLDDDLVMRVKLRGYRLYLATGAYVVHRRCATVGAQYFDTRLARKNAQELLQAKYGEKMPDALYGASEITPEVREAILDHWEKAENTGQIKNYSRVGDYLKATEKVR